MRLKNKDIKEYRLRRLKEQQGICPLCGTYIAEDEAVLDHNHATGKIRQVLHRSCNQSEGRIKSWIDRSRGSDQILFLKNLVIYLETEYTDNPEHPIHLVEMHKKFKRMSKIKQIEQLTEYNVILKGTETKSDLLKLYKKYLKNA